MLETWLPIPPPRDLVASIRDFPRFWGLRGNPNFAAAKLAECRGLMHCLVEDLF